jgi:hypothetical protein
LSDTNEETVDLNDINIECIDDPVLVHLTRVIEHYENETILHSYDAICLDCVGDKKVIAFEHLDSQAEEDVKCKRCDGTGRITRTQE